MSITTYKVSRLELAQKFIVLKGSSYSLEEYPTHTALIDGDYQESVWLCGRQVAKTETANTIILTNSIARPDFNTLYVSPSKIQTSRFSHSRLSKSILMSDKIREGFVSNKLAQNVYLKIFSNGAEVNLTYADDDPDRARGIPSDFNIFDETQDMLFDGVIPIINESLSNSPYGNVLYLGTPKTLDNTLQYLWDTSSKSEWVVQCHHCSKYSIYFDEKCVGPEGIFCLPCWGYVNVRYGFWQDTVKHYRRKGFHIPQVIIPANVENPKRFKRLKAKLSDHRISHSTILNEVFGVSSALGTRLLTKPKLESLCGDYTVARGHYPFTDVFMTFAGVDWSGGGEDGISRTALWIYCLDQGLRQLRTLYFKIFYEDHLLKDIKEIADTIREYGCMVTVTDAENKLANTLLQEYLGVDKVFPLMWGAYKELLKWNGVDRYYGNRTMLIDEYMAFLLKAPYKIFPNAQQMVDPIDEFLANFEHTTRKGMGRRIWSKYPTASNDSFCASVYAWLAKRIALGELTIIV